MGDKEKEAVEYRKFSQDCDYEGKKSCVYQHLWIYLNKRLRTHSVDALLVCVCMYA